jgi:hypothetical protein
VSDIQAIGGWRDNAEMIADVARLGYLPEPVLDMTHNAGRFWRVYRPTLLVTNDLDPQWDTDSRRKRARDRDNAR